MRYIGIDLHKRFLVACVHDDAGCKLAVEQIDCRDTQHIARFFDIPVDHHSVALHRFWTADRLPIISSEARKCIF